MMYHGFVRIVVLVARKGGTGKTTLACSLAVAAMESGGSVAMLDADPQATANAWYQMRDTDRPDVARVDAAEIPSVVEAARGRYDLLLIDTPGQASASNAALRVADLCLIPCRPAPADILASPGTMAAAKKLGKAAAFVLCQVPPRGRRASEAAAALAAQGAVAPVHVVSRIAFADAFGLGLGVTEFEPHGKAADEIRRLWQWTKEEMK